MIDFYDLAAQCAPQIHQTTLATLIQHESSGNPYAIGVNGHYSLPRQPRSKAEAIRKAKWLQARGYDFDAGLGQINIRNAKRMGLSITQLFDPCENLRATSTILTACYQRAAAHYRDEQKTIRAALSCYNTGNFSSGMSNGYVRKMIRNSPFMSDNNPDLMAYVRLPHSQIIVPNVVQKKPHKKTAPAKKKTILTKQNAAKQTHKLATE